MSTCFICDKSLSDGDVRLVKERGVQKLIQSSIKREQKEHEVLLKNLKSISVHKLCYTNYIDERRIITFIRRRSSEPSSSQSSTPLPTPPPLSSPTELPQVETFDFANKCFLCAEVIPADFEAQNRKKPVHLRRRVHHVRQFSTIKKSVTKWLENREDADAQTLRERICNVSDTDGANAKYHQLCMTRLETPLSITGVKRGRPLDRTEEAMEKIYDYISGNDECQFKLSVLENQLDEDSRLDPRTIRTHLKNKYGDDICIFELRGHDAYICMKGTGYNILSSAWYDQKKCNQEEERLRVVKEAAAIVLEDIRSCRYDMDTYPSSDDFMKDVFRISKNYRDIFQKQKFVFLIDYISANINNREKSFK